MEHRESAFALDKTLRSAQAVVRRHFVSEFLRQLGLWLSVGSVAAIGLVLISKWSWPDLLTWWPFTALASLSILGAAIAASRSLWTSERAARELDRRLGLHDTLGSALELQRRGRPEEAPFIRELTSRAEAAANNASASEALRFTFGPAWSVWPVCVLLVVLAAWFIPERSQLASPQAKKKAEEVRETAAELRTLAQTVAPRKADSSNERIAAPEADEAISALERELSDGKISSHEARVRAAEELNKKSAELEKRAVQQERRVEEAKRALSKAAARSASETPQNSQGARIAEALRKGDIDSAAEEIEKLAKNEPSLSPDQRDATAKEIDRIASALDPQAAKDSQKQSEERSPAESIRDAARDAARQLRTPESPETATPSGPAKRNQPAPSPVKADKPEAQKPVEATPRPEQSPQDEQGKPAEPEKKQSDKQSPPNSEQERSQSRQEKQTDKQEQKQTEKPQGEQGIQADRQPDSKPQDQPGDSQSDKKDAKSDKSSDKQNEKGNEKGANPESERNTPSQAPIPQQSEGQQQPRDNAKPPDQGKKPEERVTENSQNQRGTPSPQQQPGENQKQSGAKPGQNEQQGEQKSSPTDQSNVDAKKQDQKDPQRDQVSGQSDTNSQRKQDGTGGAAQPQSEERQGGGNPAQKNLDQLAKELRSLSKKGADAKRQQETARGLRDRADQMMESASPEDRARMEQLAKQLAHSDSNPARDAYPEWHGPTQTFDTRPAETSASQSPDSPPDRTIAEWLSEPKPGGKGPGGVLPAERLRKATEGAQQAIEQQAIPPRYTDLVKRVFKRYSEAETKPGAPK